MITSSSQVCRIVLQNVLSLSNGKTEEYWENVTETAKDFVRTCLTIDPTKRPTAEEMLDHKWLSDSQPHFVEDKEGNMTNLLPHIQRAFDARKTCKFSFISLIA